MSEYPPSIVDLRSINQQTLTARDWSKDLRFLSSYFAPDRIYQLYHDSANGMYSYYLNFYDAMPYEEGLFVKMIYLLAYNSSTSDIDVLFYNGEYPFYSQYFNFPVKAGFYGVIPFEFALSYPLSDWARAFQFFIRASGVEVALCFSMYHEKYKFKDFSILTGDGFCGLAKFDVATYDSYSTSAGSEVVVAKWDYGAVYNIRKFYNLIKYYISTANTNSHVAVQYSTDDSTYNTIWELYNLPTSESEQYVVKENFQARYIRFTLNSGATTSTAYLKIFPNLTWVPR
jgi:hypothetical protein